MKKLILFTLLITFNSLNAQVSFEWAKKFDGGQSVGKSIVVDEKGNSYITGFFIGTVDFDPSPNVFNLSGTGGGDIFICKINAQGNLVWAKGLQGSGPTGGSRDDQGLSISIDSIGNVYTTGFFRKTVDFDPGINTYNLTVTGSTSSNSDAFVLKLDSLGDFEWAIQMGNSQDYEQGNSITADNNGFIYVAGLAAGNFISKINSQNGNIVWSKSFTTSSSNINIESIQTDKNGNVYTVGNFNNTVDFDPGSSTFNITAAGMDVFISKLDSLGNFVWAKSFTGNSSSSSKAASCIIDDFENLIIYGDFNGTVDFDPNVGVFNLSSSQSVFLTKLDTAGNLIWGKNIEGANVNDGVFDADKSLSVDKNGNIYLTGHFQNTVDFNPDIPQFNLTSQGGADIFICLLDSSGIFNNAFSFGSSGLSTSDLGYSIAIDNNFSILSTGYFHDVVDFDPSSSIFNLTGASNAKSIFILKLSQCTNVYGTDIINSCDSYTWIDNITYTSSNNSATHTLTGGSINGCDSIVTLSLTITNIDNSVTNNTPTLTANQGGATYRWLDCVNGNAVILGETSQNFTPTISGNYAVEITVGSCVDTSSCTSVIISSIIENDEIKYVLFPNPTSSHITLKVNNQLIGAVYIICDNMGKMVMSGQIKSENFIIELDNLSNGIYLFSIGDNNKQTFKVIKN